MYIYICVCELGLGARDRRAALIASPLCTPIKQGSVREAPPPLPPRSCRVRRGLNYNGDNIMYVCVNLGSAVAGLGARARRAALIASPLCTPIKQGSVREAPPPLPPTPHPPPCRMVFESASHLRPCTHPAPTRRAAPRRAAPRRAAPRHATPRHATPRHATPRHATPRHATPRRAAPRHAGPPSPHPPPRPHPHPPVQAWL